MADIRIINVVDYIVQNPGAMPSDLADLLSVNLIICYFVNLLSTK